MSTFDKEIALFYALIALGYKPSEAEKMVKRVAKPDLTSEQVIREALKAAL